MKSGLIVVNKEAGFTSFDVVAKLRGILHMKKIGHTGTLDPSATGVLPIVLGKATKAVNYIEDHDKTYIASLCLGKTTDTYDGDGAFVFSSDKVVSKETFLLELEKFLGKQKQIPPMYSAKKVNGKKLYELAREGIEVERKPEDIEIYSLKLLSFEFPFASIEVNCSKGTYIRSLIHDLGQNLGCGAYMTNLNRTKACGFSLNESYTLDEIQTLRDEDRLDEIFHPIQELFSFEEVHGKELSNVLLENGNKIPFEMVEECKGSLGNLVCFYHYDGRFAGLFKKESDCYKPEKFFLE
ncbi:MAG: tRNA pseudouridine(55) synthase TruB [Lachnospiraceae bacterium]|nr:tRNA pseudouridine(55) synthase TruB [Lachnospiraceae bacterium]